MTGWENSFAEKIENLRLHELKFVKQMQVLIAYVFFIIRLNPVLLQIATFGVFAAANPGDLTPVKAFVSIQLFAMLLGPLVELPWAATQYFAVKVSLNRIEGFLCCDESERDAALLLKDATTPKKKKPKKKAKRAKKKKDGDDGDDNTRQDVRDPKDDGSEAFPLVVSGGTFSWDLSAPVATLRGIDFAVPRGKLCAVIGATGSGKSSVVHAILGEITKLRGHVASRGTIAYVPQTAWIYNATVRENVLFGLPYDRARYRAAVAGACLRKDLAQFAAGDKTEIGDKGVNLSGGQKQRVSIARAL